MQIAKNKTLIALLLMSAMAISLFALPTANAQSTRKSYPFIGALPNPAGVGQEVLLHVGITHQLASTLYGWERLTVTVTRPDGTTETLGPIKTDSTGGTGYVYVPAMAGNYTLQTNFPEQKLTVSAAGTPANTTFLAGTSEKLTLVVLDMPFAIYPVPPLPTEYWTRPIDAQLREWYKISGSWLADPANMIAIGNDYAPDTAHILWTKPLTTGGTVGGTLGDPYLDALGYHSYEMGDAYEGKWSQRFILGGKVYYQKYAGSDPYKETVCVDLHTGEQLWSRVLLNNLTLSRGQLMYWDTYDYHGVYDYLWATGNSATRDLLGLNSSAGTIWCAFDPFTGDYVATLTNMPSGTFTYGPKGEMLIYTFDYTNGWMTLWNSSNIPTIYSSRVFGSMGWGQWKLMGRVINATGPDGVTLDGRPYTAYTTPLGLNGYQWNKTIAGNLGKRSFPGSVGAVLYGDRAIGQNIAADSVTTWGFSLKPGQEGQVLFNKTWTAPTEWAAGNISITATATSIDERLRVLWAKETRKLYGFSLETGDFLWVTETPENYFNIYSKQTVIAYGKVYSTGCSGITYCYDKTTGELLWAYHAEDPYTEILWNNDWWTQVHFICNGKIYLGHQEHSPIDPRPRGAPFICLNATTGEVIWRINGAFRQNHWGGEAIIGDGIIATMDSYDQLVYGIGKGPSATSVLIRNDVVTAGSSMLIQGMVTDVSPGTEVYARTARFPSGVPAVSDASMSEWMLYVYKQFQRPSNATGVEVALDAIDPNGNFINLGTVTSDASGTFGFDWATPDVPGKYTVIATFAGSGAYYGSYAETYAVVTEAPPEPLPPVEQPPSMTDTYVLGGVAAIIVAIAIVGAVIVLMFRKRP